MTYTDEGLAQRQEPAPSQAPVSASIPLVRLFLIGAVLAAAMLLVHLTPIRSFLADTDRVRASLKHLGLFLYPGIILAVAVLIAASVPRLAFCVLGGMIFGFWRGLLLVQAGTLLAHYGVFLFIRWGGRDFVLRRWPSLHKWANLIHDHGIVGVILIRQAPAHAMLTNTVLGLSNVKHRDFLIGTAIGLFPEAIPATLVGAGLVKSSLSHSATYLVLATATLALIWIAFGYALRMMRSRNRQDQILAAAESLKGIDS